MSKSDFEILAKHTNQFEVRPEKYQVPDLFHSQVANETTGEIPAFQKVPDFTEPKICTWSFMSENEVIGLLTCKNLSNVKKILETKLCHSYPKAGPKIIITELLYSVLKFATSSNFSVIQTATLLSMFYLTHRFFTISYASTAEDVFYYFKDILSHHSLEYVPFYTKIFDPNEAHKIFHYFCKLYLRHLPIIRLMGLPSFEFELSLFIEPPPVFKKAKKGKDKKADKGKGKKGKK